MKATKHVDEPRTSRRKGRREARKAVQENQRGPFSRTQHELRIRLSRADLVIVSLLFIVSLALFVYRLGVPSWYEYDEVYHAFTAEQYLLGNPEAFTYYSRPLPPAISYTWNHPPLGLWLIASGIETFGNTSFGWRLPSALFGSAGAALAYLLGLYLARSRPVGVLTSTLLLASGLYLVQSRVGTLDIFEAVFLMGALLCFHLFLTSPLDKLRWPLVGTGILLGLGIATKWDGAYPAVLVGLVVLSRLWKLYEECEGRRPKPYLLRALNEQLVLAPLALVVLPMVIYILAYTGFFVSGHSWGEFVRQQQAMFRYHSELRATHPYSSPFWSWPLDLRGVRYSGAHGHGIVMRTYALGNPLVFWALLPAVVWVCYTWYRERHPALPVLSIGFFGQWLPWMLVPRIAFLYHFLPALPFGCLAVAVVLRRLWRSGEWRRVPAVAYVGLVVAAFCFFYPIYTSLPLSPHAFGLRMWLPGWR